MIRRSSTPMPLPRVLMRKWNTAWSARPGGKVGCHSSAHNRAVRIVREHGPVPVTETARQPPVKRLRRQDRNPAGNSRLQSPRKPVPARRYTRAGNAASRSATHASICLCIPPFRTGRWRTCAVRPARQSNRHSGLDWTSKAPASTRQPNPATAGTRRDACGWLDSLIFSDLPIRPACSHETREHAGKIGAIDTTVPRPPRNMRGFLVSIPYRPAVSAGFLRHPPPDGIGARAATRQNPKKQSPARPGG